MNKLKKWLKDIATEPDGETICPVRVLALLTFIYAFSVHAYSIFVLKAVFDLMAFGTAWGIMLTTLGISLGIKTDAPHGVKND